MALVLGKSKDIILIIATTRALMSEANFVVDGGMTRKMILHSATEKEAP